MTSSLPYDVLMGACRRMARSVLLRSRHSEEKIIYALESSKAVPWNQKCAGS